MPRLSKPAAAPVAMRPTGLVRAGDRAAEIVSFEDAVVGYFVDAADLLGVPKSVAAIYGICFASSEPLSFSEINDRLEISSGSISQGLRVLKEVGALKLSSGNSQTDSQEEAEIVETEEATAHPAGTSASTQKHSRIDKASLSTLTRHSRTARYEPDLELRKLVLHWIEQRLQTQLKSGHSRLEAILKAIPRGANGSSEIIQRRLESLQTWHEKARALLPVAKTFLKLT